MFLTLDLNPMGTNNFGGCFACEEANSIERCRITPFGLQQQEWIRGLSMIANDIADLLRQKHALSIYKNWFRISHGLTRGRIKELLFLPTFRGLSASRTESTSAPI